MLAEVNFWTCVILFGVYFCFDILYSWFIISVQQLKAVLSASISVAMYGISAIGVIKYTENSWYMLPIMMGAGLGTYFFIKFEKKKQNHPKSKNNP